MPSHILHRHTQAHYPVAVAGDGCYLIDDQGKRYLDASGGAAVSCLGHSHPAVKEAMHRQIDQVAYAHTGFFTNEPLEALGDFLSTHAPEGLDYAYIVSGGSEAVEAAIKMARQYFVEQDQPQKRYIIAREQSYHGNTLGALAAGGNRWRQAPFKPLLMEATHHIAPCYAYRHQEEGESEEAYGLRAAEALEEAIAQLGAENIAAFMAEPVVGATMGCVPPVKGYFKRIREICDQHHILLILDEVMCGMGRTGTLFACEQEGIRGDIIAVAKGLGGGYGAIGATILHRNIYNAFASGSGFFQHGHTYLGHPIACAAALAVQRIIQQENLLSRVVTQGEKLDQLLREHLLSHPHVGDIRGRGLFRGIELVAHKGTKAPLDPALGLPAKIKKAAMDQGLMCYPMGGTIDGKQGAHILLAPPYIIRDEELKTIATTLRQVLDLVLDQVLDQVSDLVISA